MCTTLAASALLGGGKENTFPSFDGVGGGRDADSKRTDRKADPSRAHDGKMVFHTASEYPMRYLTKKVATAIPVVPLQHSDRIGTSGTFTNEMFQYEEDHSFGFTTIKWVLMALAIRCVRLIPPHVSSGKARSDTYI